MEPLILTLRLEECLQSVLDEMRKAYFPPERNYLSAHVTMFHALQGEHMERVVEDLEAAARVGRFAVRVEGVRFLGKGVALDISSPQLLKIRDGLAERWWEMLTAQDRQKYRPHVTVQNKVEAGVARKTFEMLKDTWTAMDGRAVGLELWRYCGGPWEGVRGFGFKAGDSNS